MYSANKILEVDQKLAALNNIANNYVAQQQQPQGNRYGLSDDEVSIANGINGGDENLSNDQRQQIYAQQRQKLRHMRADRTISRRPRHGEALTCP